MNSNKKIVFSFRGKEYSRNFLVSWTVSLNHLINLNKYDILLSQGFSDNSYNCRLESLGVNMLKEKKLFENTPYDVCVMIDSEILFKPTDLETLIDRCLTKYKVVSGLYTLDKNSFFASTDFDSEFIKKDDPLLKNPEVSIKIAGMGFLACRKDVLDEFEYPFFDSSISEEISFSKTLSEKNIPIILCPDIRVLKETYLFM